jgi:hypothetical protein
VWITRWGKRSHTEEQKSKVSKRRLRIAKVDSRGGGLKLRREVQALVQDRAAGRAAVKEDCSIFKSGFGLLLYNFFEILLWL